MLPLHLNVSTHPCCTPGCTIAVAMYMASSVGAVAKRIVVTYLVLIAGHALRNWASFKNTIKNFTGLGSTLKHM